MQAEIKLDLTRFNTACAVYSNELKKSPRDVVTEQAGLLMVDLGRNLPPKDPDKTKSAIEELVMGKFSAVKSALYEGFEAPEEGGKAGHGQVRWLTSGSKSLFGVDRDKDMTGASVAELRKLFYTLTGSGKQRVGHRGKQRVYIVQRITTKESTLRKLIKDIQGRVGLLRASFLKGLREVPTKQHPPAWVAKLIDKASGSFINGLNQPGRADFTIISNAAGCTSEKAAYFLQGALDRRGNAMMTRISYLQRQAKSKAGFGGAS